MVSDPQDARGAVGYCDQQESPGLRVVRLRILRESGRQKYRRALVIRADWGTGRITASLEPECDIVWR